MVIVAAALSSWSSDCCDHQQHMNNLTYDYIATPRPRAGPTTCRKFVASAFLDHRFSLLAKEAVSYDSYDAMICAGCSATGVQGAAEGIRLRRVTEVVTRLGQVGFEGWEWSPRNPQFLQG